MTTSGPQHGHIIPRPDGTKAQCGGPMLCEQCRKERDASWPVIELQSLPVPASVIAAKRLGYEPFGYTERS
ncbi:hypothetical protein [Variovorax sp. GT1P44]|uniref:hypothetical protein n=1 Tax=Variovorax sp. GT1P44 TaxID=3443742 RepID=UPI003F48E081